MHQIQRQYIEVTVSGAADARHWQRETERFAEYVLKDTILEVLEAVGPPNRSVWIDRIDLDAGMLDARTFEHDLKTAIRKKLREVLTEQIASSEPGWLPPDQKSVSPPDAVPLRAFRYFLQHGIFPWWYTETNWTRIEEEFLETLAVSEQVEWLKAQLSDERSRNRLAWQFSPVFQQQALTVLFPENRSDWPAIFRAAEQLLSTTDRFRAWAMLWEIGALRADAVFQTVPEQLAVLYRRLVRQRNRSDDKTADWLRIVARHFSVPESFLSETAPGSDRIPDIPQPEAGDSKTDKKTLENAEKSGASGMEEAIYVKNAGLVLVWVFIKDLLADCGFVDGKRLTDPNRAVQLLQYAVTGLPECHEADLPLNKLLCGMELTDAVEPVELQAYEREHVDDLLRAVLRHWSVLKNTSPAGLRVSFLQRTGRLTHESDHYQLVVEQEGYDLLLDQLPWGFSVVQLPWMPEPLFVNWV